MAGTGLQPALLGLIYAFPGAALIVILVRLWTKHSRHTLGGDDVLIVLSWLFAMSHSVIEHFYVLDTYSGYWPQDVPLNKINKVKTAKLRFAMGVVWNPVISLVKASFMWSLQRLQSPNPWIQRSLYFMQWFNGIHAFVAIGKQNYTYTLVSLVPCQPFYKNFDPKISGYCYNTLAWVIGNVTIVIVTDALVMMIPSWIIYDLQMPLKRKLIGISFLSLGGVVMAIEIARLVWLQNAFKGKSNKHSVDSAFSAIESSVAIIGASGPTVKYLFSCCIPALRSEPDSKTGPSYDNNGYGRDSSKSQSRRMRPDTYCDLHSTEDLDVIEMKDSEAPDKDSTTHNYIQRTLPSDSGTAKMTD